MCHSAPRIVTSITATQSLRGSIGVIPEEGALLPRNQWQWGKVPWIGQASGASRNLRLPQGLSGSRVTLDDK